MSDVKEPQAPENAVIVNAGAGRQDAVDLGDGIFVSKDVSNLYLVTTGDGNVLINTGFVPSAAENKRRIDAVNDQPIRKIIFTQSHEDHIGGWPLFTGPGVETIAQTNIGFVRTYFRDLGPAMARRSRQLWSRDQKHEITERIEPVVTTTFQDSHAFQLGGRRFELYSVKGGETIDSLVVWLPREKIVFTGNMTGPLFGHVPNLYTVRGDHIRYVQWYIDSVQRVIDLEPETLITGHGDPVRGRDAIRATLTKMRDVAQSLRDQVFKGMNDGVDLWTLMGTVKMPPELAIPQGHGKVPWIVRAIWEEHLGWFRYESSTELYNVPPQAVSADWVELAGGASPVLIRAEHHLVAGRPLEALHLAEAVESVEPDNRRAWQVKLAAHEKILADAGRENFSEVRWLESQITALKTRLGDQP